MTNQQTPERPETLVEQLIAALKWQAQENGCYCETDISADEAGIPIGERCPYCLMGKACQELEALASRAVPSTGEATDLMLGDLEYWRKFLLRARSRAGETPEASVHIDHLTAAALCIGNVLKFLQCVRPSPHWRISDEPER